MLSTRMRMTSGNKEEEFFLYKDGSYQVTPYSTYNTSSVMSGDLVTLRMRANGDYWEGDDSYIHWMGIPNTSQYKKLLISVTSSTQSGSFSINSGIGAIHLPTIIGANVVEYILPIDHAIQTYGLVIRWDTTIDVNRHAYVYEIKLVS